MIKNILYKFLEYLETIVNIFSNALIQTFLVYTTVVLIYKFYIEDQTTNYIPTFISEILNKIRKTFTELDFIRDKFSDVNKQDLETKYEITIQEEAEVKIINKAHNAKVINNALKMSIGILFIFIAIAVATSRTSINIHWYQLLLSAVITVVGTSYEYFFITQIIVKYNFIELTKVYDALTHKIEQLSENIIETNMVNELQNIVQNHKNNTNNNNNGINNLVQDAKNILGNVIDDNNNNNIVTEMGGNILKELTTNNNNNGNDNGKNNLIAQIVDGNMNVNNLVNKAGVTLNDIGHDMLKESFTN